MNSDHVTHDQPWSLLSLATPSPQLTTKEPRVMGLTKLVAAAGSVNWPVSDWDGMVVRGYWICGRGVEAEAVERAVRRCGSGCP